MSTLTTEQIIEHLLPRLTQSRRERMLQVVSQRTLNIAPVLENIYDRGNTSAVMRSAEAFGFINFQIIENPEAKFKTANRVSQGTDKWLQINKSKTTEECLQKLKSSGFKIYATHLDATTKIEDIDFSQKTAVIFGNEKEGVSEEALNACDGRFIIPMYGFAQSFNISVAAALCFQHIHRDRCARMEKSGDLDDVGQRQLLAKYLLRSVPSAEKILQRLTVDFGGVN